VVVGGGGVVKQPHGELSKQQPEHSTRDGLLRRQFHCTQTPWKLELVWYHFAVRIEKFIRKKLFQPSFKKLTAMAHEASKFQLMANKKFDFLHHKQEPVKFPVA
jgi:hypothetical protein